MRRPKFSSLGFHLPRLPDNGLRAPNLKTLGPGSVSSLLKIALDVAYVLLGIITGGLIIGLVVAVFIPFANLNLTVSDDSGGLQQPLTRPLLIFGVGAFAAFFGSFMLILRNLRSSPPMCAVCARSA